MECENCGHELNFESDFGYLALHQSGEVLGHIYSCSEGRDGNCLAAVHNGFFYTLVSEDHSTLHEGYPC